MKVLLEGSFPLKYELTFAFQSRTLFTISCLRMPCMHRRLSSSYRLGSCEINHSSRIRLSSGIRRLIAFRAARPHRTALAPFGPPLLRAIPFFITLNVPFLSDSYSHLVSASRQFTPRSVAISLCPSAPWGLFFRPLGYLDYWLEYKWAGFDPVLWHSSNTREWQVW